MKLIIVCRWPWQWLSPSFKMQRILFGVLFCRSFEMFGNWKCIYFWMTAVRKIWRPFLFLSFISFFSPFCRCHCSIVWMLWFYRRWWHFFALHFSISIIHSFPRLVICIQSKCILIRLWFFEFFFSKSFPFWSFFSVDFVHSLNVHWHWRSFDNYFALRWTKNEIKNVFLVLIKKIKFEIWIK